MQGGAVYRYIQVWIGLYPKLLIINLVLVVQFVDQGKQRFILLFALQYLATIIIVLFTGGDHVTARCGNGKQNAFGTCAHAQFKSRIYGIIRVQMVLIDNRQTGISALNGGGFGGQWL
ncbi:hypothetical protein Xbed_03761 [Xenorhabdus beddingii]|uniref:Uncharacterized protein n=1 Tax=Xenorhabdus beddingii TaxID=40578 RepID=A0A1Y2S940_9GAMM|nr:hypothetical protein Xbed_03761 [Xenorhabdus beddingii]